jgi:DNA-directed RNA polymerase subunit RPC12/RpoP
VFKTRRIQVRNKRQKQESLQSYANKLRERFEPSMPLQQVLLSTALPNRVGGRAEVTSNTILVAEWMAADMPKARATVRHEMAHAIGYHRVIQGWNQHYGAFKKLLMEISPCSWKHDLHWYETPAITKARDQAGIRPYKQRPVRYLECAKCGRHFTCGGSGIASYIQRGLFLPCRHCGGLELIEIIDFKTRGRRFVSVRKESEHA